MDKEITQLFKKLEFDSYLLEQDVPDMLDEKNSSQILVLIGLVIIGVSIYWGYKYYRTPNELIDQESD